MIADLIDGLLLIAFYAALAGVVVFAYVLGARAIDAHHRGMYRIRHHRRSTR